MSDADVLDHDISIIENICKFCIQTNTNPSRTITSVHDFEVALISIFDEM